MTSRDINGKKATADTTVIRDQESQGKENKLEKKP